MTVDLTPPVDPAATGAPEPPAPAVPAPAVPPTDPAVETTISMPKDAFEKRLEQARRAAVANALKEHGFESPEALKTFQADAAKRAQEAEEAKRAEMTELEQAKTDLAAQAELTAAAELKVTAAEEAAEASRIEAHVSGLLAERGIKNSDYAFFKIEQALSLLPDADAELDEVKLLDDLLADPVERVALGIAADPKAKPAQTADPKSGPDPKPNDGDKPFDAMTATPEEFEARMAKLGARH